MTHTNSHFVSELNLDVTQEATRKVVDVIAAIHRNSSAQLELITVQSLMDTGLLSNVGETNQRVRTTHMNPYDD